MLALIVLLIVNALLFMNTGEMKKNWTVYGTMGCGWTRKQLDHMKAKKIPHTFVDCDKGGCPSTMRAFPTLVHANGEETTGYKEV